MKTSVSPLYHSQWYIKNSTNVAAKKIGVPYIPNTTTIPNAATQYTARINNFTISEYKNFQYFVMK